MPDDTRAEREDRHGDHWVRRGESWWRVEDHRMVASTADLERDYGPTREGHGPDCIRPRIEEMDRNRRDRERG